MQVSWLLVTGADLAAGLLSALYTNTIDIAPMS